VGQTALAAEPAAGTFPHHRNQTRFAEEVSRTAMTTMTCFDPRIPTWAARGLVHAGNLLADQRVS
jgi:hypothetical protein